MGVKWEEAEFLADALCCKRFIKGLQNTVMRRGGGVRLKRAPQQHVLTLQLGRD